MVPLSSEETRQLTHGAILEQLAEGVIVTDAVGTITFVNRAAADIHGMARLDVKPNAYSETYHLYREDGRNYPSDELPLARAVRGETVVEARWRIRRPDGREILAVGTARPLRGPNGRRIGAILTLRDATAQDVAERASQASETALRDARQQLLAHTEAAIDAPATPTAKERKAGPPRGTANRLVQPLQDLVDSARRLQETTSLQDARLSGQHMQATASALLALVEGLSASRPSSEQTFTLEPAARRQNRL